MKKKNKIIACSIIVALIIINIALLYPRELNEIIGKELNIDSGAHLTIMYRSSILEKGTSVRSHNSSDSKKILDFLKLYKYMRSNVNYSKLDDVEYYIIVIKNNGEEVFRAATRGDSFFSVIDKDGRWGLYRVQGSKLDIGFLREFYDSLSKDN